MKVARDVTVIMAARDAQTTVGEALGSVAAQSRVPASLILVDDGSADGTAAIARGHRGLDVRVLTQPNAGPSAARNRGLEIATTEFVTFLDADDRWPPCAIELLLSGFAARPDAAVVQGRVRDFWPAAPGAPADVGHARLGFNLGSSLWRRSVVDDLGRFDERLRRGEDIDLWVRLAEQGRARIVIEPVTLLYRRRTVSDRDDRITYVRNLAGALKRSLDRTPSR
jgi:glycosyltransferase involved in cell wall biosynthesis